MTGISPYLATALLNAVFDGTTLSVANRYLQVHVGDPGVNGTGNLASNTQRVALSNNAAVNGVWIYGNTVIWDSVPAAETYTHVSVWDAPVGGNCLWTGPMTQAQAVNQSDSFTLATNALSVSVA